MVRRRTGKRMAPALAGTEASSIAHPSCAGTQGAHGAAGAAGHGGIAACPLVCHVSRAEQAVSVFGGHDPYIGHVVSAW